MLYVLVLNLEILRYKIKGNLPENPVTQNAQFESFCRGNKPFKIYICVFICFSTKAVHFEVVDSFMNGFSKSSYKTSEISRKKIYDT